MVLRAVSVLPAVQSYAIKKDAFYVHLADFQNAINGVSIMTIMPQPGYCVLRHRVRSR